MVSGAYIQHAENEMRWMCDDDSVPPDSVMVEWNDIAGNLNDASASKFKVSDTMKHEMEAAGFVDIVEKRFKIPLGAWSSDEHYREIGMVSPGVEGFNGLLPLSDYI